MVDVVDPATRSRMMSGIRGANTRPEVELRRALHRLGLRFRLHDRSLPGRPDIVLARWKAVILVHGCFWHRHGDCRYATTPATRPEFWIAKFDANRVRDQRAVAALKASGWRVAIIWECALRKGGAPAVADVVRAWLVGDKALLEVPFQVS